MKNRKCSDRTDNASTNSPSKSVKVIAISAGKGGVGKTNVAVNLSISLAQLDNKILLMDADLGLANIDIMLGLRTKYNLSHVIQGKCHLNDIILTGPLGIKVIPAASGTDYMTQLTAAQHAGIIDSFNELTDHYDYMIIDTAAGISETVLSFTRSSQEVIVVVCNEPTSLTDSYALIKVMSQRFEWEHFRILANMVHSAKEGRELYNRLYRVAEQFLDVRLDYLGALPFDERIHHAVRKQQPVTILYSDCKASKSFQQMAYAIERWPFNRLLDGNTSFFLERIVAENLKKNQSISKYL